MNGRKYLCLKDRADLLMALAGSSGAPGLTADTPGAPPGASTPPCPGAASLAA